MENVFIISTTTTPNNYAQRIGTTSVSLLNLQNITIITPVGK